ncbi:MAG: hypothetical protein AAGJ56_09860 [Myxococcota bacterium]
MQTRSACVLILLGLTTASCSESAQVTVNTGDLSRQAALVGVELDEIALRVTGRDFGTIEQTLTPESEVVRLSVPPGPARRFELAAIINLNDADLPELPAFFGEAERDLTTGANVIELPYRAQGALRLAFSVVGDDIAPNGDTITLVNEAGETIDVPVDRTTVVPVGRYRLADTNTFFDPLQAPESLTFDIAAGDVVVEDVPVFSPESQCLPNSPDIVREGCIDFAFAIEGLEVDSLLIRVNGVSIEIDADGNPLVGDNPPGVGEGQPYSIEFESAGDNPRQACTVVGGEGIGAPSQDPIAISCGPLLYPVGFSVFGPPPSQLTVTVFDGNENTLGVVPLSAGGEIASDLLVSEDQEFDTIRFILEDSGRDPSVACTDVDGFRLVDGSAAPVRVFCLQSAEPVYPTAADLGQHLLNDGPDVLRASGARCTDDATGFDACIHAGLMRTFEIPGYESCENLVITDNLEVLDWVCRADNGVVTAYSRHRSALENAFVFNPVAVGPSVPTQRAFSPIVEDRSEGFSVSGPAVVGWSNPLERGNGSFSFATSGTIYLIEGLFEDTARRVVADEITVLVAPGGVLEGTRIDVVNASYVTIGGVFVEPESTGSIVRGLGTSRFLSVGGRYDGTESAIELPAQSELRNAEVGNTSTGVFVNGSYGVVVDSRFTTVGGAAIDVAANHQRVSRVGVDSATFAVTNRFSQPGSDVWIDDLRARVATDGVVFGDVNGLRVSNSVFISEDGANIDGLDLRAITNVAVFHTTFEGFLPAIDVIGGTGFYFEGILSEGVGAYRLSDVDDAVLRDQALFTPIMNGMPEERGPIVSVESARNVRAEGRLVYAEDIFGSCLVPAGNTDIGFLQPSCVDGDGELPAPSSATADVLDTFARAGIVTDSRGERVLGESSPVLNLSPDPAMLRARVITWATTDGDCAEIVHDSVKNDALGTCENVFLEHAREVDGDGDGFCESDETCRYLPDPGGAAREAIEFETVNVSATGDGPNDPELTGIRLQIPTAFAELRMQN